MQEWVPGWSGVAHYTESGVAELHSVFLQGDRTTTECTNIKVSRFEPSRRITLLATNTLRATIDDWTVYPHPAGGTTLRLERIDTAIAPEGDTLILRLSDDEFAKQLEVMARRIQDAIDTGESPSYESATDFKKVFFAAKAHIAADVDDAAVLMCPIREAEWEPRWTFDFVDVVYTGTGVAELGIIVDIDKPDVGDHGLWVTTLAQGNRFTNVRTNENRVSYHHLAYVSAPDGGTDLYWDVCEVAMTEAGGPMISELTSEIFQMIVEKVAKQMESVVLTGRAAEILETDYVSMP